MTPKKTIKKARIEFATGVPETLFKKANGQCSVPRCKRPTIGPSIELESAINMGVACHIYSAAKDGPRGRSEKDEAFIKSEANGIWCCQYHAALIDKKKGVDYPAPTLIAWKKLAEARTLKKMNDIPSPLGWVESIEFSTPHNDGLLNPKVTLSRYTILTGRNGSGKTVLHESAAAICNSKYFKRIAASYTKQNGKKIGIRAEAKIIYTTVDSFSKELHVIADNFVIRRKEGNTPCLLPPGDIEVIFCSEEDAIKEENEDDANFFMKALNVDSSALHELVGIGPSSLIDGKLHFRNQMEENQFGQNRPRHNEYGEPWMELVLTRIRHGRTSEVAYNHLSTSEKGCLLLALAITKAREVSKQKLTLLAIDGLTSNFDEWNFEKLLRALKEEDFQVLVTLPSNREDSITDVVGGNHELRHLDYLSDWTLWKLQSPRFCK